ncbi:MAG TPA: DUF222 domain-containing protein [Ilumatobacter sp.]|nr:DUF222 domain-containing protein [Ilumatobacter sp.]
MSRTADPSLALAGLMVCDVTALDVAGTVDAGSRLRVLRGWLDSFEASLSAQINRLYAAGSGAPAAEALSRSQGVSAAEGRRRDRRSKALDEAPSFADALAAGAVGAEHADALANATAKLDEATKTSFLEHEAELLSDAKASSPEDFRRRCKRLLTKIEHDQGIERAERQRRETHLSRRIDVHGMHHISGVFHPELGAALFKAIDLEVEASVAAGGDRAADRQHLAAQALANLAIGGHQQVRPIEAEISVVIDVATLTDGLHDDSVCEYDNGVPLPPETVRRLCCQGVLVPIFVGADGVPLDLGRDQRLASRVQRRALRAMYRTCGFAGCDVPFNRCEIHHLVPWEVGGPTDLANLIPICSHHHHVVHEGGWSLHLAPDRLLTIRQRDGDLFATVPIQIRSNTRRERVMHDTCERARQRVRALQES